MISLMRKKKVIVILHHAPEIGIVIGLLGFLGFHYLGSAYHQYGLAWLVLWLIFCMMGYIYILIIGNSHRSSISKW